MITLDFINRVALGVIPESQAEDYVYELPDISSFYWDLMIQIAYASNACLYDQIDRLMELQKFMLNTFDIQPMTKDVFPLCAPYYSDSIVRLLEEDKL